MTRFYLISLLYTLMFVAACAAPNAENPSAESQSATPSASASTESPTEAATPGAEPTATELKQWAQDYKKLKAINDTLEPSNIHGSFVKTFLDVSAFEQYQTKSFPYADQTLSFKESYSAKDGAVNRLYMMKKIKGYDPDNGDWYYAVMSTEGVASQQGKVSFCISCHASAKDKDYIYGF